MSSYLDKDYFILRKTKLGLKKLTGTVNNAVKAACTVLGREREGNRSFLFGDFHGHEIRAYPRHPRNPCYITGAIY
ncbi:MAG: hypothetical protein Q8M95_15600 [Candidatus Methanoperedens sp.]|nr:hypothetical protein [Candidatus Methanoperedens sp.]